MAVTSRNIKVGVGSAGLLTTLGVGVFLLTEDVYAAGIIMVAIVLIFGAVLLLRKPARQSTSKGVSNQWVTNYVQSV